MSKALILTVFFTLTLSASAQALTWSCTCRDSEGNDLGGVTVTTSATASWDDAVRRANRQCKQQYSNAVDGANCDSND